jgi:hypothetical protein
MKRKIAVHLSATRDIIFRMKKAAIVKVPDDQKDRKQIVKETKRDLDEMLSEPSPIGNLADLVKALKKAKKK